MSQLVRPRGFEPLTFYTRYGRKRLTNLEA